MSAAYRTPEQATHIAGHATGDDSPQAEARTDQVKAGLKQASEAAKDAFRK